MLILLIGCQALSNGQGVNQPKLSARHLALGGHAGVLAEIGSAQVNPAILPDIGQQIVRASLANRFFLEALNDFSVSWLAPTVWGSWNANLQGFGLRGLTEYSFSIGYGRALFDQASIGVRFHYLTRQIDGFPSRSTFTFDLGFVLQPREQVVIGINFFNLIRSKWSLDNPLSSRIDVGVAYTLSDEVAVFASLEKYSSLDLDYHFGLEYVIVKYLTARLGYQVVNSAFSFGVGLETNTGIALDIGVENHQILGISPAVSLAKKW